MEKNQSKTIIGVAIALLVVAAVFVFLYGRKNVQVKDLISQNTNLTELMGQKDSIATELENTFTEIEDNLRIIREKRNQISVYQSEGEGNRRQAIVDDINKLNVMLEENQKKVAELEKKLAASGSNSRVYERRIARLNDQINSRNQEIMELKSIIEDKDFQLADLSTRIMEMDQNIISQMDTIRTKQQMIETSTKRLNKGSFIVGTRKELREKGLLDTKGGFLGIGRTKKLATVFPDSLFTPLDIGRTTDIPLYCKKAFVLTEHPRESFELVKNGDQVTNLRITDPKEFWRISRYAMIQVK